MPASVLKIATVSAALAILGPDYRFLTEFHTDDQGNLYIRGFGDPTLFSEEIEAITRQLLQRGLRRVRNLYIDDSAFALTGKVPGQEGSDNPYDAPVGALSVNFNSLPIFKDAAGRIASGEPQTPTLPIMTDLGKDLPAGHSRVNICSQGCDADTRMARYAGELFQALLQKGGIPVGAIGGIRTLPAQRTNLLYTHHSARFLTEISRAIFDHSSNFMANLVFLTCGACEFGYPATWKKAETAVHAELSRQLGQMSAEAIRQVDGAGLSRQNRVTVRAVLQLLAQFRSHAALLKKEGGVALKTGTLSGVYNAAGYLSDGQPFVILLNQKENNRAAVLARLKNTFASRSAADNRHASGTSAKRSPEK